MIQFRGIYNGLLPFLMVSIFTEEYQNNDKWTSDGWPKLKEKAVPIIPEKTINNGMELSDDFGHNELRL